MRYRNPGECRCHRALRSPVPKELCPVRTSEQESNARNRRDTHIHCDRDHSAPAECGWPLLCMKHETLALHDFPHYLALMNRANPDIEIATKSLHSESTSWTQRVRTMPSTGVAWPAFFLNQCQLPPPVMLPFRLASRYGGYQT